MDDALPDQDGCAASSTISPWSKTVVHVIMFEMMYVSMSKVSCRQRARGLRRSHRIFNS